MPDVPVLALTGDLDTNTPARSGRAAASEFRRVTFVEVPNVGHTPEVSPCGAEVALRFIQTLKASPRACAGTGAPPPVAARSPRTTAELPLAIGAGAPAERRAVAVVAATIADMTEQTQGLGTWGAANGLRAGRYVLATTGAVRLVGVRVVRDATVEGALRATPAGETQGNLRLAGSGVPDGHVRVTLAASGRGRLTGTLDGRPIDLALRP